MRKFVVFTVVVGLVVMMGLPALAGSRSGSGAYNNIRFTWSGSVGERTMSAHLFYNTDTENQK